MSGQIMVVPMDEMLEVVEKMNSYANISYSLLEGMFCNKKSDKLLISSLCEFHAGANRTKETVLSTMSKEVEIPEGTQVPENCLPMKDEDYLLVTNLLLGMMTLEADILGKNISLSLH